MTDFSLFEEVHPRSLKLTVIMPVYNEHYLVISSLKRLLAVESIYISEMEVIVVDDKSTDGSWEALNEYVPHDKRIRLIRQEKNMGKGAAIRLGLTYATGDACVIHDADMEYNPHDIPALVKPMIEEGADAVFGSRYLSAAYRRVLMYRHSLINKFITFLVNCFTDLDLTDVETCYKLIKTDLFKSVPIRSNDFRFEIEIAMKLAKRRVRVFEAPIRYLPRSYAEGKKIGIKDGLLALMEIVKLSIVEDLFKKDMHGLKILMELSNARRFNKWLADQLRPHMGDRILEIGAGIGNLTNQFIPRRFYLASDIDPYALQYLNSYAVGKPYLKVMKVDAGNRSDFARFENMFDTILMINVLEHVHDEAGTLQNLLGALRSGGRAIILVPQSPQLHGSLDRALEHRERYTRKKLEQSLTAAGFEVEKIFDFNRISVVPWFINGKLLGRKRLTLLQIKLLEILMPLVKQIDRFIPWPGLSLIAIAKKKH